MTGGFYQPGHRGPDGKYYATPEQIARRRECVVLYFGLGFSQAQIAAALGCSASSVADDLMHMGVEYRKPERPRADKPPGFNWRRLDPLPIKQGRPVIVKRPEPEPEPEPEPVPEYVTSRVMRDVRHFNQAAAEEQHIKTLACQLDAAAGDPEWTAQVRAAVIEMQQAAVQMLRLIEDHDYRDAVMRDRDANIPPLRAVGGVDMKGQP